MKIKYIITSFLMLAFLAGCATNNSDVEEELPIDTNTTTEEVINQDGEVVLLGTVILTTDETTVTLNNDTVNIDVKVIDEKNNPYLDGDVKIVYPNDVREGRDVGYFASSTVAIENGRAAFSYTAPDDISADTSNIEFGFYHESNPSQVVVYTIKLTPQENQIILTNYKISNTFDNNETMGLESSKLLNFFVSNSKDEQVDDSKMQSIKVSILNPTLGTLEDTLGNTGITLTIEDKNPVTVNIKSNTVSGIMPIKVETVFEDENGNNQSLSEVFNVIVLSGPPSAMSLSYSSTTDNQEIAKFIETWVLTVTDKYNNLVNTNPAVSMGMIAGFAKDSSNTATNDNKNLYFLPSQGDGTINGVNDNFTAKVGTFDNVDQTNDYLVTFGNGYTYDASGKWSINTNSSTVLDLVDDFDGVTTTGLGFAVGNNHRQDACREGQEWVGNVYPEDNNYIIDNTGSMRLNVEYDYYLAAKDVMLWVNIIGEHNNTTVRIGEAKKINLRAVDLTSQVLEFSAGFSGVVRLHMWANYTAWLRNSRFGYAVKVNSDGAVWNVSDTSMNHGITYCYGANNQFGQSYVDVNFTSPTPTGGTVSLQNLMISSEF